MDQYFTVKATARTTTKGVSRNLISAASSAADTNMAHGTRYFNFCGLPRELRDMIYEQFQRLHPETPMFDGAGRREPMITRSVKTKPITPLLLVNKRIGSEYRDACKKRSGVIVSEHLEYLLLSVRDEERICARAETASFIHMHAGNWMSHLWRDDPQWSLNPLKDWFEHWSSQMPKLDSITVSIYLSIDRLGQAEERRKLEEALEEFVSLPRLKEIKVITMDNASHWEWRTRGPDSKKLLVHWTPSSVREPMLIDSPQPYVENCCECYVRHSSGDSNVSGSDSGDSNRDFDDPSGNTHGSSRRPDHGNDNGNDSYDDFEGSDENNDAGNGSNGDMGNSDRDDAENVDEDSNEDSDDMGSGGTDASGGSENNQAPSYFDFFGLPPEIRDMIYDQPSLLEKESPISYKNSSGRVLVTDHIAATKPNVSLLLVSRQSSSEYKKRSQLSSGLFSTYEDIGQFFTGRPFLFYTVPSLQISRRVVQEARFMHMHVGEWDPFDRLFLRGALEDWLRLWGSQMPNLHTITVNIYLNRETVKDCPKTVKRMLTNLMSLDKLSQLKLIIMKEAVHWRWASGHGKWKKKTLVDWKRGDALTPQSLNPPVDYYETCCENWPWKTSPHLEKLRVVLDEQGEGVSDDELSNCDFEEGEGVTDDELPNNDSEDDEDEDDEDDEDGEDDEDEDDEDDEDGEDGEDDEDEDDEDDEDDEPAKTMKTMKTMKRSRTTSLRMVTSKVAKRSRTTNHPMVTSKMTKKSGCKGQLDQIMVGSTRSRPVIQTR
jgi:hypothetical protein